MLAQLKKVLYGDIINFPGSRTNRNILILESDDWGAQAIPDKQTYKALERAGVPVGSDPFCRYDNIASKEDLTLLFDLLLSFKDFKGNPAVVTANAIMANPDYEKIKASDFKEYFYESITRSFERHSFSQGAMDLWQQGIRENIFVPQFHGREHLNVPSWLRELRSGNKEALSAFDRQVFSISYSKRIGNRRDIRAALNFQRLEDAAFHQNMFEEGLQMFKKLFGYKSQSFIAPCYTWSRKDEEILAANGVSLLQGNAVQLEPRGYGRKYKKRYNYTGKQNRYGQRYLVRNVMLEPAQTREENTLDRCLKEIATAFKYGKPALVSIHRLNFIGSHDPRNRDKTLYLLRSLLQKSMDKWPELEFHPTSDMLNIWDKKNG